MEQSFDLKVDKYIYLSSVNSTNQYAQEYTSKSNPDHNYCIYTYNQLAGKGQNDRKWYSGTQKNLSCSFIIKLNIPAQNHFMINMAFALATFDFLKGYINDDLLKVKWPNDLYYNNNKLGGILIQNSIRGKIITQSILGAGINLNENEFPLNLPNPISVYQITQNKNDLLDAMMKLTDAVENRFKQLSMNVDFFEEYSKRLYKKDDIQKFVDIASKKQFEGLIKGINHDGKLIVLDGEEEKSYNFRELEYIIE